MDSQIKSVIGLIVRHAVNAVGAGLVTNGYTTSSELEAVSGGIVIGIAVAWSAWQKRRANAKPKEAIAAPAVK